VIHAPMEDIKLSGNKRKAEDEVGESSKRPKDANDARTDLRHPITKLVDCIPGERERMYAVLDPALSRSFPRDICNMVADFCVDFSTEIPSFFSAGSEFITVETLGRSFDLRYDDYDKSLEFRHPDVHVVLHKTILESPVLHLSINDAKQLLPKETRPEKTLFAYGADGVVLGARVPTADVRISRCYQIKRGGLMERLRHYSRADPPTLRITDKIAHHENRAYDALMMNPSRPRDAPEAALPPDLAEMAQQHFDKARALLKELALPLAVFMPRSAKTRQIIAYFK